MAEIFEMVIDAFFEHWAKVGVGAVLMGMGWFLGRLRAQKKWAKKEFFERVNFSLNSIQDGKLKIRTIMENSIKNVFLNDVAISRVLAASSQTTEANPILPIARDDYWFFLNSALNEVSEKFSFGFIRRDVGHQVDAHQYVLCLTNDCDGEIRTRKIRVLLIRKELLENLPEEMPELESRNHATRWKTLECIAERFKSHRHEFFTVELVV